MIKISQLVEDIFYQDDVAMAAARNGWLNLSAYARQIQPRVQERFLQDVQEGSIVTALGRIIAALPDPPSIPVDIVQSLAVHANLVGLSYERSERVSEKTREIYHRVNSDNKTFLTVTQGINEITIIAEAQIAQMFREELRGAPEIYDKTNLVGITVKFGLGNLDVPNLIFGLTRRLAFKNINVVEVVSTATELTYILAKKDLAMALEQLQKEI